MQDIVIKLESVRDINIVSFMQFQEYENDDTLTELENNINRISLLLNIPVYATKQLSEKQYLSILEFITQKFKFDNNKMNREIYNSKFTLPTDFNKLKLGQWSDIETIFNNETFDNKTVRALAVALNANQEYKYEDSQKIYEVIKDMPAVDVLPAIGFFLFNLKQSKRNFLISSKIQKLKIIKEIYNQTKMQKRHLELIGGGTIMLMNYYAIMIILKSDMLCRKVSIKYLLLLYTICKKIKLKFKSKKKFKIKIK